MAVRHKNVSIKRDELTTIKVQIAEWEVPLLHLVHGEGAVQELDGEPWADVDPPSVQDEYRRLEAKYRMPANEDGSPGQKAVVVVYGAFGASPILRQAIENATFDRPPDLLGLDALEKVASDAEATAKAARSTLERAKAASAAEAPIQAKAKRARAPANLF